LGAGDFQALREFTMLIIAIIAAVYFYYFY